MCQLFLTHAKHASNTQHWRKNKENTQNPKQSSSTRMTRHGLSIARLTPLAKNIEKTATNLACVKVALPEIDRACWRTLLVEFQVHLGLWPNKAKIIANAGSACTHYRYRWSITSVSGLPNVRQSPTISSTTTLRNIQSELIIKIPILFKLFSFFINVFFFFCF